jgi:Protein of unknown function DUF45
LRYAVRIDALVRHRANAHDRIPPGVGPERDLGNGWASCSARGRLTFDTALLAQLSHIRNEVIVHELLRMNAPVERLTYVALKSNVAGGLRIFVWVNGRDVVVNSGPCPRVFGQRFP